MWSATLGRMRKLNRISVASGAVVLALMGGGVSLIASPVAAARASSHVNASGGDNSAVDTDGTQGAFTNAVQGTVDTDGDQDAFDVINSEEASPQEKAAGAAK